MILGYYAGYLETDLDKAFRYVAWGSQYGASIQSDPIFGCISHFLSCAKQKGTWLQTRFDRLSGKYDWEQLLQEEQVFVFLLAGESGELKIDQIIAHVKRGSNLVILFSDDLWMRAHEYSETEKVEQFFRDFHVLTSTDKKLVHNYSFSFGKGKIFYIDAGKISDGIIEPGPFESWSLEKFRNGLPILDENVEKISTFTVPFVDCQIKGIPNTWPRDESLIFEVEVRNCSNQTAENIEVNLTINQELEPLSLINFQIDALKPKKSRTMTCIVVPRTKGEIENPIEIKIKFSQFQRKVALDPISLEILDPLPKLLKASKPYFVDLNSVLHLYESHFSTIISAKTLLELIRIDPSSVVQKARQVGEFISRKVASKQLNNYSEKWDFATTNRQLYDRGKISAKSKGYIDTVRIIGNLASHPSGTTFVEEDAITICQALVLFLDECQRSNLL